VAGLSGRRPTTTGVGGGATWPPDPALSGIPSPWAGVDEEVVVVRRGVLELGAGHGDDVVGSDVEDQHPFEGVRRCNG